MGIIFKRPILNLDKSPTILWENILEGSTVVTSSGDGENTLSRATNDYWTPTSLPATISYTLSSSSGAGYIGLASHNLGSTSSTLELETFNGSTWDTVFSISPTKDQAMFIPFNYEENDQWRISISGSTAPSIGVVFLGNAIQFETGILPAYTPMYMAEDIELMTATTITGQFMPNRIQRRGLSTSFNLNIHGS